MHEGRLARRQIGPEQGIFQLEPDGAHHRRTDLRDDELPRFDLGVDTRPVQLAFLPHHHAQGIHPLRRFPQQGLDGAGIWRPGPPNPRMHPVKLPQATREVDSVRSGS
jgi:hypothetical protein